MVPSGRQPASDRRPIERSTIPALIVPPGDAERPVLQLPCSMPSAHCPHARIRPAVWGLVF